MNQKIIEYYSGELSNDECKSLFQEVFSNEELKKEMIDYRQLDILMKLHLKKEDKWANKESLSRFMKARRVEKIKKVVYKSFFRVAIVLVCMLATWQTTRLVVSVDVPSPVDLELNVPAGQRAHILLPDGTSAWVNAGSTLRYPSIFGEERRVTITGEAFFEVAEKETPFIVSTGKVDVKALGTQFNVYNYPSDNLIVSLIEGSVNVYQSDDVLKGTILFPNQQLTESDGDFVVNTISYDPIGWKNGIYGFVNERMEDILKKLELYYGVKFTVKYTPLLNDRFTGKFRQYDGVMEVLHIIRKIHPFQIKKVENTNEFILYR